MSEAARRMDPRVWAAVACALGLALGGALMLPVGGLAGETVHYLQIRSLLEAWADGPWTLHPRLTSFPTYHAIVAAVLKLTGTSSLTAARTVNVAVSAALLAVFAALALRIHRRRSPVVRRVVQLTFLPILFPFFFWSTRTCCRSCWCCWRSSSQTDPGPSWRRWRRWRGLG